MSFHKIHTFLHSFYIFRKEKKCCVCMAFFPILNPPTNRWRFNSNHSDNNRKNLLLLLLLNCCCYCCVRSRSRSFHFMLFHFIWIEVKRHTRTISSQSQPLPMSLPLPVSLSRIFSVTICPRRLHHRHCRRLQPFSVSMYTNPIRCDSKTAHRRNSISRGSSNRNNNNSSNCNNNNTINKV